MDITFQELYDRLLPWLGETTGLPKTILVQVIEAQEKFWEMYGDEIERALDDEDDE